MRTQASQASSLFLSEAVDFGLQWNGTELGRENRLLFAQNDVENLERQKRQLEFGMNCFMFVNSLISFWKGKRVLSNSTTIQILFFMFDFRAIRFPYFTKGSS